MSLKSSFFRHTMVDLTKVKKGEKSHFFAFLILDDGDVAQVFND